MKRVYINIPGKILNYRDITGIRTPTYIDVEDQDFTSFKVFLDLYGISEKDYTIEEIQSKDKFVAGKKKTTGLKSIHLSGARGKGVKLNLG